MLIWGENDAYLGLKQGIEKRGTKITVDPLIRAAWKEATNSLNNAHIQALASNNILATSTSRVYPCCKARQHSNGLMPSSYSSLWRRHISNGWDCRKPWVLQSLPWWEATHGLHTLHQRMAHKRCDQVVAEWSVHSPPSIEMGEWALHSHPW